MPKKSSVFVFALMILLSLAHENFAAAKPESKQEEQPSVPHVVTIRRPSKNPHDAKTVTPEMLAKAKEIYLKYAKQRGEFPLEGMKELYKAGGFETVKTLIENKVVSPKHSEQMADLRILMMLQTFEGIIKGYKESGRKIRIHRSDSGNQKAGMSSDVDQTIYVEEFVDGQWKRVESLDPEVSKKFREMFQNMHGLTVEALDIATINGKDKFPDWRVTQAQLDAEGKRPFAVHAADTLYALEHTPGAYQETGAVLQQMQLRAADLIDENLRKGTTAKAPEEPREMAKALKDYNGDFRLNQLVFITIGEGETPGDTKIKAREAFQEDAERVMFDGLRPELIRGHAYDAAVANYLESMHHINDKNPAVKYPLRGLDDGMNTWKRLTPGGNVKLSRVEYSKIPQAERRQYLEILFGKDLAQPRWDGSSFIDRWQMAFDIDAKLRDLHSSKKLNDESAAEVFRSLAEQMAGKNGQPQEKWRDFLGAAREEYNQRTKEFLLYNIIETSNQRVVEWMSGDPKDPGKRAPFETMLDEQAIRRKMKMDGAENDAKWAANKEEYLKNYSELARLQLVSTLRKIKGRPDLIKLIVDTAEQRGVKGEDLANLKMLVWESSGVFLGKMKYSEMPKMYGRYYLAELKRLVRPPQEYAKSMMEYLAHESGFVDTPEGPRPTKLLKALGFEGLYKNITESMQNHKLAGITDRFLGNMFFNIGVLQSASTVLRAYSENDGNWEETYPVYVNELLNITPVVGLIKGAIDGGLDLKQQSFFVAGMISPAAGLIMVAYAIGENGIVLYEHNYSAPLTNEIANAIYHGYVGPSLYDFSKESHPDPFTSEDAEALDKATAQVKELSSAVRKSDSTIDTAKQLAKAGRTKMMLENKKSAWKAWQREDNLYRGSAVTSAHMVQQKLDLPAPTNPLFNNTPLGTPGALLARIKPMIFYARSNEGPVDFTIPELTSAQKARLKTLDENLKKTLPPHEWVPLKREWAKLDEQQKAYERAQRYLEEAKKNYELMHQIQRDSMYPFLLHDDPEGVTMLHPRNFAAYWVSVRSDILPEALAKLGVNEAYQPWDRHVLDALGERIEEDMERSKRLWIAYEELKKAKAKSLDDNVDQEQGAYAGEVLMQAAEEGKGLLSPSARQILTKAGNSEDEIDSLSPIAQAYLERNIPESPPEISIGMRLVPSDDPKIPYDFRPDVTVTANPKIYIPPYFFVTYVLDPKTAKETLDAKNFHNLPLDDSMINGLKEYLKTNPPKKDVNPKKDTFTPAVLTFVFCSKVEIPPHVVKETVSDLPVLQQYTIPVLKGMKPPPSERSKGYLFGGGMFAPMEKAIGPLEINSHRQDTNAPGTTVEISSQAMGKLDKKNPDQGILFTLERATDKDGPWEEVLSQGVFPPREKETEIRAPKLDQMTITDGLTFQDQQMGKYPNKPVFYRVKQQSATREPNSMGITYTKDNVKTSGKEEYSEILEPGVPLLRITMRFPSEEPASANSPTSTHFDEGNDNETYVTTEDIETFPFGSQLILSDQYFNYAPVKYKVTMGPYTGYLFSPPAPDPKQKIQYQPLYSWDWNLPVPHQPTTIHVQAESESDKVTENRTISVNIDPQFRMSLFQQEQQALVDIKNAVAERPKKLADVQARIDEYQKFLDNLKPVFDKWDNQTSQSFLANFGIESARGDMELKQKFTFPAADATMEMNLADIRGDYPAKLNALLTLPALHKIEMEINQKMITNEIGWLKKKIDYDKKGGSTESDELKIKEFQKELDEWPTLYEKGILALDTAILETAVKAGDAAVFRQVLDEAVALSRKYQGTTLGPELFLVTFAEPYVRLTGDRKGGAKMWTEGYQMRINNATGTARQDLEKSFNQKPSWWPSEGS